MSVRGVLAVAARGPGGVDVPWNLRTRDLSKWCVHARARSAADPDLLPIGDGTYAHATNVRCVPLAALQLDADPTAAVGALSTVANPLLLRAKAVRTVREASRPACSSFSVCEALPTLMGSVLPTSHSRAIDVRAGSSVCAVVSQCVDMAVLAACTISSSFLNAA